MTMKHTKYILPLLLSFVLFLACDEYQRTAVQDAITVNESSVTLFVGDQIQLTASPTDGTYSYQWTSENSSIATVSQQGLVEAVSDGNTNIIVNAGNLKTRVGVTAIIRIPLENVTLSESLVELVPGAKKTIMTTLIPEEANDLPKAFWYSENEMVAVVSETGEIAAMGEGSTNIVYKIGEISKKVAVDVTYTRPFNGPHTLSASTPCIVKAADFDFGGEGYGFHDSDSSDASGQNGSYRKSKGDSQSTAVDIEGAGQNVGWTNPGEWLLYTIDVKDAGDYQIEVNVAVPGSGSSHLEVDGRNATGSIAVPNTGGWGSFQWVKNANMIVNFSEGKHKVKYYFETGHNFKELRFTKI